MGSTQPGGKLGIFRNAFLANCSCIFSHFKIVVELGIHFLNNELTGGEGDWHFLALPVLKYTSG